MKFIAIIADKIDHFRYDVEHYGEEPPTWWWEQNARYEMYRALHNESIGNEVEKRAAFFLVLFERVRSFMTTTLVCKLLGHAHFDCESGCCERCGEFIAAAWYKRCARCGATHRRGQSCICFDNNCQ